jgi:rhamnosyltransferase subunit B
VTRYLLVTHGTRGDVEPFVALAAELVGRGHPVSVLTHASFGEAVRATGADPYAVDDDCGYEQYLRHTAELVRDRPAAEMGVYYRDAALFFSRLGLVGGLAQVERETKVLLDAGPDTAIVARHTSSLSALIAAEATGRPLWLVALAPSQLAATTATALHLARTVATELNALRAGFGLPPVKRWSRWLTGVHVVAGLWPGWFDRAGTESPPGVLLTGFPLGDRAIATSRVTDGHAIADDTIVVTGGTGRMLHPGFYRAAIAGVAAAGRRAVVVTPHADLVPSPLPDGVRHVAELSFAEVLPQVAGIVHHGGVGTTARALAAGVPQLVLAHGGDRPDNGARLRRVGLAACLEPHDWSPDAVAGEIARFGEPPVRERARVFAAGGSAEDPIAQVAEELTARFTVAPGTAGTGGEKP